jgi:hypothetical protein
VKKLIAVLLCLAFTAFLGGVTGCDKKTEPTKTTPTATPTTTKTT